MERNNGAKDLGGLTPLGGSQDRPTTPATVLHIDDDPNDTELLRAAVAQAELKLQLQNVEDGDRAMDYLRGRGVYSDRARFPAPDLILLDLQMPRATGLEVLQWIRRHSELGAVPVVVLSGSEFGRDRDEAYAAGANSYILKPLSLAGLVQVVQQIWAQWLGCPAPA